MKETPLIRAASRTGPLPTFLFASPVMTGFVAIFMCPVFFGVFFLFPAMGYGRVDALELFDVFRNGAIIGLMFGAVLLLGIAVSAVLHDDQDERQYRRQFDIGGIMAIALLVIADMLALETVRSWIEPLGSIVYQH